MAGFYQRLIQDEWSLEPLGLEDRGPEGGYFCTPVGARCFGWPGVDGIHFCFLRGHREMVFAVSPMNTPGTCVHPIAKTFRDFLRLLLSCSEAALEQLWQWDREQFEAFVAQDIRSEAAQAQLDRLAVAYGLRPVSDPYGYVRSLQQDFREDSLVFPEEYEALLREAEVQRPWAVFFSGGSFPQEDEKPGQEIILNRSFSWKEQPWRLLSVYVCQEGLVGDLAVPVEKAAIEAFQDKWLFLEAMGLTEDQARQAQEENPFLLDVQIFARINGTDCRSFHGSCDYWSPLDEDAEAARWLDHYGLDREAGWILMRTWWPHCWQETGLEHLVLRLKETPALIDGPVFTAREGDRIEFVRPATGQRHTLIVEEGPAEEAVNLRQLPELEYPTHCRTMVWRVEPELPRGVLYVQDRDQGDQPRAISKGTDCAVAVIGGADGPTALLLESSGKQAAVSRLYFELPEQTHWRLRFREPRRPEKLVDVF